MKFAIITHVNHIQVKDQYFGYAPYIHEMNIWLKHSNQIIVVAPIIKENLTPIDLPYNHSNVKFKTIPSINFTNLRSCIKSILKLPLISWKLFWAMKEADHIHLRCPGNIGLIACFIQILFPAKNKTAKYAGNWDPKSKQPVTYNLQKWILKNTFLTHNMKVLVYGRWKNQTGNILPFFTASYSVVEKEIFIKEDISATVKIIFTGTLVEGKNPLYAIKLVEELNKRGIDTTLDLYGEGVERKCLEKYILQNGLNKFVFLHGNQVKEVLKKAYQKSHFVILPSKSEGWPKTIAEGMFWGCVPLATNVSCVPCMIDYGKRGLLLKMNIKEDVDQLQMLLLDRAVFLEKSKLASDWSQNYTTEFFESQIKELLQ